MTTTRLYYSAKTLAADLSASRSWAEHQASADNIPGRNRMGRHMVRYEAAAVLLWVQAGCPPRFRWPADWEKRWPRRGVRKNC